RRIEQRPERGAPLPHVGLLRQQRVERPRFGEMPEPALVQPRAPHHVVDRRERSLRERLLQPVACRRTEPADAAQSKPHGGRWWERRTARYAAGADPSTSLGMTTAVIPSERSESRDLHSPRLA